LTIAVWLSVMFAASTNPFRIPHFFLITPPSADFGGPISEVTANFPASSIFSRLLSAFSQPPPLS
ncbi:MAG: hypothetical protein JSV43_07340, partial [Methanobacteriota archaeon]